jgi:hypothetical protein
VEIPVPARGDFPRKLTEPQFEHEEGPREAASRRLGALAVAEASAVPRID